MAGGTRTQTTTQETAPWAAQQPYLADLFKRAHTQLQQNPGGPQFFPGQTVADLGPDIQGAVNYARNFAGSGAQAVSGQAQQTYLDLLRAPDVVNSQIFSDAANAAIRPVVRQFNETVLPNIRNNAVSAGQYGGSRQAIAEGIASDRLQQNTLDTTSRMALEALLSGQRTATQAVALYPQAQGAMLAPTNVLEGVGQLNRAYQQALIDEQMARWSQQQMGPYQALQQYQNFITGNFGGSGLMTQQLARTNPLMAGLGGAATGAGIASALGPSGAGLIAAGSPVGWGVMGAGALLGLLGS